VLVATNYWLYNITVANFSWGQFEFSRDRTIFSPSLGKPECTYVTTQHIKYQFFTILRKIINWISQVCK